jgi:predicted metal-binding membrane protein
MAFVGNALEFGRERFVALASLLGVVALAWLHLWHEAARMDSMPMRSLEAAATAMEAMSMQQVWSVNSLLLTFLMWSIMMVGMMLPSATPAIFLYGSLAKKNRERGTTLPSVWIFTAGYLAMWTAFSLAVTILQAAFNAGALLTPLMVSDSPWLSGGLLIVAGIYQWLPVKDVCLEKCRAPLQFFLFRWKPGALGAFRMGAEHGVFCTGCCWALMLLLFTVGVMNLIWVATIAGFVFVEKLLPPGRLIGRLTGVGLVLTGTVLLLIHA